MIKILKSDQLQQYLFLLFWEMATNTMAIFKEMAIGEVGIYLMRRCII